MVIMSMIVKGPELGRVRYGRSRLIVLAEDSNTMYVAFCVLLIVLDALAVGGHPAICSMRHD